MVKSNKFEALLSAATRVAVILQDELDVVEILLATRLALAVGSHEPQVLADVRAIVARLLARSPASLRCQAKLPEVGLRSTHGLGAQTTLAILLECALKLPAETRNAFDLASPSIQYP